MEKKVLSILKPKVSAFGFDKNEVKSIAAEIANNLNLEEDATDDDIDATITKSIDAVLPYLKLSQSQAQRVISDFKKKMDVDKQADEKGNEKEKEKVEKSNTDNSALKELSESVKLLQQQLQRYESEKQQATRKTKLETLLKDAGTYGKAAIRNFERMKFDKEEDFDNFFAEIEDDLKNIKQEKANEELDENVPPQQAINAKNVMSDKEIEDLAKLL